jgi:hypothetical protein
MIPSTKSEIAEAASASIDTRANNAAHAAAPRSIRPATTPSTAAAANGRHAG